uniref:RRM domain-containing protein n=1 Tax=Oryza nivara TaxID=4536 RepID=A0A0E0J882_ORYNI
MPPAAAAEAEISPPPPAADGGAIADTAEAGVAAEKESDGMEVEDRGEVVSQEATAVKPDEAEEPEEDPEEVGEGAEEAPAAGPGDVAAAAAESGPVAMEAGDGEPALEVAITAHEPVEEEPKDVMETGEEAIEPEEDEEPEEAEVEEDEEPEELEMEEEEPEDADSEESMEEEAGAEVSEEEAAADDMKEIADKDSEEAQDEDKHGDNHKGEVADQLSNDEDVGGRENDESPNDELDTSLLVLDSVPDGNDKTLELFVGGLPKDCVEEDIRVVFSQCGEVESIRIVKKRKRIAFVRYADISATKKALTEFKDGIKVNGKSVRVSVAEPHRKSSEQKALTKVKTVYLEHFPRSWDERNIEECCEGYGNIQKVNILRSKKKVVSFVEFSSRKSALACVEGISKAKINDREVKLAASLARPQSKVQLANESSKGGFNVHSGATSKSPDKSKMKKDQTDETIVKKSQLKLLKGDESKLPSKDDVEVPQTSTHSKGKAKVGKRQNTSIDERPSKKSRESGESKLTSQDEGEVGKSKSKSVNERPLKKASKNRDDVKLPSQSGLEEPQTSNRSKRKRKVRKNRSTTVNERPVEKAWKNRNMKHPAGSRYVTSNQAYPTVGATSRSKPHSHDLAPHAGFIPPSSRVQRTPAHDHQRTAPYNIRQISGSPYARERVAPRPAYSVHTSNAAGYEAGYAYTYLPPPPPPPPSISYHPPPPASISYHPGSGPYIIRRYY